MGIIKTEAAKQKQRIQDQNCLKDITGFFQCSFKQKKPFN